LSVACDRNDDSIRGQSADTVVACVCDEESAVRVDCDFAGGGQPGSGALPTIADETEGSRACNRADDPGRRHLSDTVIIRIGDEQGPASIHGDAARGRNPSCHCLDAITAIARDTNAGDRGDDPTGCDLANARIAGVGNIEIARRIERQASRVIEQRRGRQPPITAKPGCSDAGDRSQSAIRGNPVHPVLNPTRIAEIEPTGPVRDHRLWSIEALSDRLCTVDRE
jgi:hypothetical protein